MERREFIKVLGGGVAMSAVPGLIQARLNQPRPHIFMVFSDDLTWHDLGCYGDPVARTPHIDQLAREGMVFDNMFTPCPMCGPSRASMFTGLYTMRHGAHPNWSSCKPGTRTMAHYMEALGYRTILLGKRHIKPDDSYPFEHYADADNQYGPGSDLKRILDNPGDKPLCIIMCKFHAHFGWFHNKHNYDPEKVHLPPYLVDTPETRELRANYYSYVEDVDIAVGHVTDLLKEHKVLDDTLFIWTADHGSQWPHERQNIYDAALYCPFIARWPGHIKPGTRTRALTSLVDIVPTFIDVAGGDVDSVVAQCGGEPLDGKSLSPILRQEKTEHHEAVFGCVTWGVVFYYPMRSVRTKQYKYIWNIDSHFRYPSVWTYKKLEHGYDQMRSVWTSWERKARTDVFAAERVSAELHRPVEELYDIQSDPYELKNLAGDPSHYAELKAMRMKLKEWMDQQGDAGDSAYHGESHRKTRFRDKLYCRQEVVHIKLQGLGLAGGIHDTVRVEMTSPVWTADIHYTLDGTEPMKTSPLFTEPFMLDPPVMIKAKGFWDGGATPVREYDFDTIDFRFLYDQTHQKPNFWP